MLHTIQCPSHAEGLHNPVESQIDFATSQVRVGPLATDGRSMTGVSFTCTANSQSRSPGATRKQIATFFDLLARLPLVPQWQNCLLLLQGQSAPRWDSLGQRSNPACDLHDGAGQGPVAWAQSDSSARWRMHISHDGLKCIHQSWLSLCQTSQA